MCHCLSRTWKVARQHQWAAEDSYEPGSMTFVEQRLRTDIGVQNREEDIGTAIVSSLELQQQGPEMESLMIVKVEQE